MRDIYTTAAERITLFEPANLTVAGAQYERACVYVEAGASGSVITLRGDVRADVTVWAYYGIRADVTIVVMGTARLCQSGGTSHAYDAGYVRVSSGTAHVYGTARGLVDCADGLAVAHDHARVTAHAGHITACDDSTVTLYYHSRAAARDQATVYNYSQYGESAVAVEDGVSVSHERALHDPEHGGVRILR